MFRNLKELPHPGLVWIRCRSKCWKSQWQRQPPGPAAESVPYPARARGCAGELSRAAFPATLLAQLLPSRSRRLVSQEGWKRRPQNWRAAEPPSGQHFRAWPRREVEASPALCLDAPRSCAVWALALPVSGPAEKEGLKWRRAGNFFVSFFWGRAAHGEFDGCSARHGTRWRQARLRRRERSGKVSHEKSCDFFPRLWLGVPDGEMQDPRTGRQFLSPRPPLSPREGPATYIQTLHFNITERGEGSRPPPLVPPPPWL